jgi:hypothetical protein
VLIFGISQRSGTNFLANLLLCHPDCVPCGRPVLEGHLLADAGLLARYARATARRWPRRWGDRAEGRRALLGHLGEGLMSFVEARGEGKGRVVVKTPSPANLDLYPQLFPAAHVVLLVRDGRSVVESLHTGFRRSYSGAGLTWRAGARSILSFVESARRRHDLRWTIVRYEDLLGDVEGELRRLLTHLDLDPDRFDFERARTLPVFGSSFIRVAGGSLTWQPVEREVGFDPARRFEAWPRSLHERFRWIAGREQRALGYGLADDAGGRVWWALRNLMLDAARPAVAARDTAMRLRIRAVGAYRRRRPRRNGR